MCKYIDAGYVGDNYTWKSVTVCAIIINRVIISWFSDIHKTIMLPVTEAEYSEVAELCCKILFN